VPEIEYAYDTTPPGGLAKGGTRHTSNACSRIRRAIGGARSFAGKMVTALASDLIAARTTSASTSRWSWIASTRIAGGNGIFLRSCAAGFATRGGCRVAVAHPQPSRSGLRRIASGLSCSLPELHAALRAIPYLDGQLRTTRQARNYEAEERRAEDTAEGLRGGRRQRARGRQGLQSQAAAVDRGAGARTVTQEASPPS